jgi:DNA-binding NarL/FixJ family response regulator
MKTMIIDDDEVTLRVLEAALDELGYDVVLRQHALGTMNEIARQRPDVVVLDVRMPGLSGDYLAALLAQTRPGLTVILHSSVPSDELHRLTRACGATGCIEKTGDPIKFCEQFRRLLSGGLGTCGPTDSRPNEDHGR